jgi:hypothetical protein
MFYFITKNKYLEYNGITTRNKGLQLQFDNVLTMVNDDNSSINYKLNNDKLIFDIVGYNLIDLFTLYYKFGNIIVYFQDSQIRYYLSKLKYKKFLSITSLINLFRAILRELFSKLIFKKVIYISYIDASIIPYKSIFLPTLFSNINLNLEKPKYNKKIAIYANYNYEPNILNLKFIENLNTLAKILNIKIDIVGHNSNFNKKFSNIFNNGTISSLDVLKNYDFVILTAKFGSGIKNKIIELNNLKINVLFYKEFYFEYPYNLHYSFLYSNDKDLFEFIKFYYQNKIYTNESFFNLYYISRLLK